MQSNLFKTDLSLDGKLPSADQRVGRESVTKAIDGFLREEMGLFHMTQLAHWNGEGDNFYGFHKLTESQYSELLFYIDQIAEHKRTFGSKIHAYNSISDRQVPSQFATRDLSFQLAENHRKQAGEAQNIAMLSDTVGYTGTSDLFSQLVRFHQKQAWILESITAHNSKEA